MQVFPKNLDGDLRFHSRQQFIKGILDGLGKIQLYSGVFLQVPGQGFNQLCFGCELFPLLHRMQFHMDFSIIDRVRMTARLRPANPGYHLVNLGIFHNPGFHRLNRLDRFVQRNGRRHRDPNQNGPFLESGDKFGAQVRQNTNRTRNDCQNQAQNNHRLSNRPSQQRFMQPLQPDKQPAILMPAGMQQVTGQGRNDHNRKQQ